MGTDNLFHKRKAKKSSDLKRKKSVRGAYEKVIIVCEGEKTEPLYFEGLKDWYRLNSANVEITGQCGSNPVSIFEYAKQRYREEREAGDPFDKVYCVFDKDSHSNYEQILDSINSATPRDTFYPITSVPCFEYWLILHFLYTTKPYVSQKGRSAGKEVLTELKAYFAEYSKGQPRLFETLFDQLEFAKSNAKRAWDSSKSNFTDNPTTRVHELVEYLQDIKKPK